MKETPSEQTFSWLLTQWKDESVLTLENKINMKTFLNRNTRRETLEQSQPLKTNSKIEKRC
jgi:hypothetical protein